MKEWVGPYCALYPDVRLPGFEPLRGATLAEMVQDCRNRVSQLHYD